MTLNAIVTSSMKMKLFFLLLLALSSNGDSLYDGLKCTQKSVDISAKWLDMVHPCIDILKKQVKTEMTAAITYLAMGAHFARDSENRPGFSKLFFESANEERQHAIKIIEYLLMRGQLTDDVSALLTFPLTPEREFWTSGADALSDALKLEVKVTNNIRNIISTCEAPKDVDFNDYHLVDYLTADFLDEQYKGQREIAGRISTLKKMADIHGDLAEFLYDKKLLHEGL